MKKILPIVIIFAALIQGCSSGPELTPQEALENNFQTMREAAMENITDESRMQQFLGHSRTLEAVLIDYNRGFAQFARELGDLNRDFLTPRSEQEQLLAAFTDKRKAVMQQVVDLHFEMVALTTAKEWKQIVEYEAEALESMRQLPLDQMGEDS